MRTSVSILKNNKRPTPDNVKEFLESQGFTVEVFGKNDALTGFKVTIGDNEFQVVAYSNYVVFPSTLAKVFT